MFTFPTRQIHSRADVSFAVGCVGDAINSRQVFSHLPHPVGKHNRADTSIHKGNIDEVGKVKILKEQKVFQTRHEQVTGLWAFDLGNIVGSRINHGELLIVRIIRRVLIKYIQPVVVVCSRRWVRVGGVFAHSLNPINKWSRFRGSGLLDLLYLCLHIQLKRVFNLAVQRTVIFLRAFDKCLMQIVGEAYRIFYHDLIVMANCHHVKPQFLKGGAPCQM